MKNLRNSIVLLLLYLVIIFGLAQINFIEQNVLNFTPAFFILLAAVTVVGAFVPSLVSVSNYVFIALTAVAYFVLWIFIWRFAAINAQVLWIQFLLVLIAAGLAYNVGQQLTLIAGLLEGLASSAYPNRSLDVREAADRISAELTRSRRYQHPLSVIVLRLGENKNSKTAEHFPGIQEDLLRRFALARVSQAISDRARETDLILRDHTGRFILLCPETNSLNSGIFAERVERAVREQIGVDVIWGAASFPDQALTFEELLELAEERISAPLVQPNPVASETPL